MDFFVSRPGKQVAGGSASVLAGQPAGQPVLPAAGIRNQTPGSPSRVRQLHSDAKQIGLEVHIFSSSLGAMVSLLGKLRSLLVSPDDQLPDPLKLQKDKLGLLMQHLEAINTSLVDLSWVEAPNMMVKHWRNEVRDLSYDIEDYIDKTMKPNPKISEQPPGSEVEELSNLVKQANDAQKRHKRYDLGCWASNPRFVVDGVPRLNNWEATDLVGIDGSKAQLIKRLNIDDAERRLLVVCIQGPPGVGKTTLAQEVYRGMEGCFDCRAFVRASKMPDVRRLLRGIISQVLPRDQRAPYGLPVQELIDSLRNHLHEKRYFIVIDGLWETTSWDIVSSAFAEGTQCSRILITTDIEEVALECCDYDSDAIYKMEPLSAKYSTELFFNRVFQFECADQLKENCEEIIRTCSGLPLATISIASILESQPDKSQAWHHVKEALFSRLRYNLISEDMLRETVGLSCDSLPHHLKTCLLYLSMYPEGYMFLKPNLVKQWCAEGFIIAVEEKKCHKVAECYFDELVCRGLIQRHHTNISDEMILYNLHSIVFEVISSMSIEENFTTVIDYSNTISEISAKVRRLYLRFSSAKYATKPEIITLSQVRSLMFYGLVECLPSIMEFEALRVLILEVWGDQEELDLSGMDRLLQLRYVQITTNVVVKLPAKMIGLQYLQTIEIYGKVTSIPSDIIDLPRLLHFCLHGSSELNEAPFVPEVPVNNASSKVQRRLSQSRESARISRLRKKTYIQQLESSRMKLAQLEQELQRARQQVDESICSNENLGDSSTLGVTGSIDPGVAGFKIDYSHWVDEQKRHTAELMSALQGLQTSDLELRLLVEAGLRNYEHLFKVKALVAGSDVFYVMSGMWKTPAERLFMWIGGFRPSEILKILSPQLEPLTKQQRIAMSSVQHTTAQAEEALSQGMEKLQQNLMDTMMAAPAAADPFGHTDGSMLQMATAVDKLENLVGLVTQADHLRLTTLQQMHNALTTRQAARGLLALGDYFQRLRTLSDMWTARPREVDAAISTSSSFSSTCTSQGVKPVRDEDTNPVKLARLG